MDFIVTNIDEQGKLKRLNVEYRNATIKSDFLDRKGQDELAYRLREAAAELEEG